MSRKIKYDIDAYRFLMELNSTPRSGYAAVIRKIHAIANNPQLRGSVHVDFDMEVQMKDGGEVMIFTQCRYVEVRNFTITYTWSDADKDTLYITDIYDHRQPQE